MIIGASSGIGKKLAEQLISNGHHVIGTFHSHEITTSNVHPIQLDVTEETININHDLDHLDGLVYCPGSINLKPFTRLKPQDFVDDFELQVTGAIKVIQNQLPWLKKAEQSSIVMFSTVAVNAGFNFHSQVAVSKGAIQGLTKALAAELAPKIRVNCIAPSLTNTPLASKLLSTEEKIENNAKRHPLKRIGKAEDLANMASFLLSKEASWISGQIIAVDGGMSTLKV